MASRATSGIPSAPAFTRRETALALLLSAICGFILQVPDLVLERATPNLDLWVHYNYAREYVEAISAGELRPRWAYSAQGGLGEPGLLYYAPLYYYAVWAVENLTGSVWAAMQWVEIASAALLGYFSFRLAREWNCGALSYGAIPLAVLAPNLALLHMGFNGYPWAAASGAFAVLLWTMLRPAAFAAVMQGRVVSIPQIAALAFLICAHTVSGLMAVIVIAATALPQMLTAPATFLRRPPFWAPAVTIAGGLLLAAWYLVPAYGYQNLIDAAVWRDKFTPFDAFSLSLVTAWFHGVRWFSFQWPVSLASLSLCALGCGLIWHRARQGGLTLPLWLYPAMAMTGTVLFLATELSYPLWLIDSPLRSIQFPHRFVTVTSILAPFLAVAVVSHNGARAWQAKLVMGALAAGSVLLALAIVGKAAVLDGEDMKPHLGKLADYRGLDEYRTAPAVEHGNNRDAFDWPAHCRAQQIRCSEMRRADGQAHWVVEAGRPAQVTLPLYHFPSWQVRVNGNVVTAQPDAARALTQISVPAGRSTISVRWQMLPLEWIGALISALTTLALAAMLFARRAR